MNIWRRRIAAMKRMRLRGITEVRTRYPFVDLVKAVAAQLIVLHHLAWFGPMSDVAAAGLPLAAAVQSWLVEYGRYAVAAFLTVSGFLAAQSLNAQILTTHSPWRLIGQRYLRLVDPFAVALACAILAAFLARRLMVHDSIGSVPTVWQVGAHLLLLHGLLDIESLSAGVWYVAIDFQLYALLLLLLWIPQRTMSRPAGVDFFKLAWVVLLACASLLYFNRDPAWDATALYFFGSYALGVLAAWALKSSKPWRGMLCVALLGGTALLIDFRPRLAVSLLTALLLSGGQLAVRYQGHSLISTLSRQSYALFLIHFPVCLLVNALITRLEPAAPIENALGVLLAWGLSNFAAVYFHRYETRGGLVVMGVGVSRA